MARLLLVLILLSSLLGCKNAAVLPGPKDYVYILRYDRGPKGGAFIDQYSVTSDQKIRSFDADYSMVYLSVMSNGKVWCTYGANFDETIQKVRELDPLTGKISDVLSHPSKDADQIFDLGDKFYIRVETIIASDDYIQKHPNLAPWQHGGFEVYKKRNGHPKLDSFIRFDLDGFILGASMTASRDSLYVTMEPVFLLDDKLKETRKEGISTVGRTFNENQYSWIGEIDTQTDKVKRVISLDPYLRGVWGIKVVGDYLYVTALEKETYNWDIKRDRTEIGDKRAREKTPYTPKFSEEMRDYNRSLFVFTLNPFKLVKKIPIEAMGRRMEVDPEAKRLFVLHEGGMGSPIGLLTAIDTETQTRIGQMLIPRIRMIGYAGHHRLYVTTSEKLLIIDTTTLKVVKEVPGEFGMIAHRW